MENIVESRSCESFRSSGARRESRSNRREKLVEEVSDSMD